MSTRSSIAFVEYQELKQLHLYREMLDGKIYLAGMDGKVEIPESISKELGKLIKSMEDKNGKESN